uniref:Uncharacterized protein n=1 Tax=Oryza sativa subsp. japonica TaxID=39947 RepID=Q6L5E6_ORYSJ|nr:unknown protein [Oryza sativa Japonica Group]AAU10690.1 unknown protein [Oryza sativa Japonica Group]
MQPPGRACWHASAPLICRLQLSQVFAIMYMAKIVVTGQELLSKLTVSSLGWKAGNRGGGVLAFVGS